MHFDSEWAQDYEITHYDIFEIRFFKNDNLFDTKKSHIFFNNQRGWHNKNRIILENNNIVFYEAVDPYWSAPGVGNPNHEAYKNTSLFSLKNDDEGLFRVEIDYKDEDGFTSTISKSFKVEKEDKFPSKITRSLINKPYENASDIKLLFDWEDGDLIADQEKQIVPKFLYFNEQKIEINDEKFKDLVEKYGFGDYQIEFEFTDNKGFTTLVKTDKLKVHKVNTDIGSLKAIYDEDGRDVQDLYYEGDKIIPQEVEDNDGLISQDEVKYTWFNREGSLGEHKTFSVGSDQSGWHWYKAEYTDEKGFNEEIISKPFFVATSNDGSGNSIIRGRNFISEEYLIDDELKNLKEDNNSTILGFEKVYDDPDGDFRKLLNTLVKE